MGIGMLYGLTLLLNGGLFFIIIWIARQMNAADPWMIDVVMRQFKYKKYYAPKPDFGLDVPAIRDFV